MHTTDHTIHFTDPLLLPLIEDTALARRTSIRPDGDDGWIATRAPRLSDGEEILWGILAHYARRESPPEALSYRAHDRLDTETLDVVVDVMLSLGEAVAS